jgi:hypothetical protein
MSEGGVLEFANEGKVWLHRTDGPTEVCGDNESFKNGGGLEDLGGDGIVVDRVLTCEDPSNYGLDEDEYEIPVTGRIGSKRSRSSAWLQADGSIRVDDSENPDFWVSLKLPDEYIESQYRRLLKNRNEQEKRKKLYEELKKEFDE